MDWQLKNDYVLIHCGDHMNLACIQDHKKILSEALMKNKPITLEADKINSIDTASLQLLLVFTQEATRRKIQWEWKAPSFTFLYVANLTGLKELLSLPKE